MPVITNPYVNPVDLDNTAPKVHASQHRAGGSDPLTPAAIGAAAVNHTHDVSGLAVAWPDVTGKPNTFPASPHAATHVPGGGDLLAIDASQITTGTVPLARLPHGCLERLVIVADDAARFALTTADVQQGDTVKVVETSTMYFVVDEMQLGIPDGYVAYTAGAASSVDWSAITGKPDTFPSEGVTWGNISGKSAMVGLSLKYVNISGDIGSKPVNGLTVSGFTLSGSLRSNNSSSTTYSISVGPYVYSISGPGSANSPAPFSIVVPPMTYVTDVVISKSGLYYGTFVLNAVNLPVYAVSVV